MFFVIAGYWGKVLRHTSMDICIDQVETFQSMPRDTFEVVALGSSHIWKDLDTSEMYRSYGIGAYNFGAYWQHLNTTELFLDQVLATQKPKVVIIETYKVNELLEDVDMDGEMYYTRGIRNSTQKISYLNRCFGTDVYRYISYMMPIFCWQKNWESVGEAGFRLNTNTQNLYETMGYNATPYTKENITPVELQSMDVMEQYDLSEDAIATLDHMVDMCRDNNVEVVFLMTPHGGEWNYDLAMKEYAKANDCAYYNLYEHVDEIGLDGETDYADGGHMNDNGARKVAIWLGKVLKEHYNLTDFRDMNETIWKQYVDGK
ncbi:MAG: SGNH/GDSL hydrolase family protein [Lachnospiraceae bacterium]|nr:SGNH/GDSL hydrolase family protein [Lachnospiraceae bacterium]